MVTGNRDNLYKKQMVSNQCKNSWHFFYYVQSSNNPLQIKLIHFPQWFYSHTVWENYVCRTSNLLPMPYICSNQCQSLACFTNLINFEIMSKVFLYNSGIIKFICLCVMSMSAVEYSMIFGLKSSSIHIIQGHNTNVKIWKLIWCVFYLVYFCVRFWYLTTQHCRCRQVIQNPCSMNGLV